MADQFKGAHQNVVVGLSFDQHSDQLFQRALSLCRRTGMGLRLVHAVPPLSPRPLYLPAEAEACTTGDHQAEPRNAALAEAQAKVERIVAQAGGGVSCRGNVIEAQTASAAIAADAAANGGALIMVGAAPDPHRFVPTGISTALTLMASAPVPVLAVRHDCPLFLAKDTFRIVIADDLATKSDATARAAISLGAALRRAELIHLHVIDFTFDNLIRRLEDQRCPGTGTRQKSAELWTIMEHSVHDALRARSHGQSALVEFTGGRYETRVLSGNPRAEIANAFACIAPDIVVFGRHHRLHRRPFGIGHIPFSAMLDGPWGVMVVDES